MPGGSFGSSTSISGDYSLPDDCSKLETDQEQRPLPLADNSVDTNTSQLAIPSDAGSGDNKASPKPPRQPVYDTPLEPPEEPGGQETDQEQYPPAFYVNTSEELNDTKDQQHQTPDQQSVIPATRSVDSELGNNVGREEAYSKDGADWNTESKLDSFTMSSLDGSPEEEPYEQTLDETQFYQTGSLDEERPPSENCLAYFGAQTDDVDPNPTALPTASGSFRKPDSATELHTKPDNIMSNSETEPVSPIIYEKKRDNTVEKPASSALPTASGSVRPKYINIVSPVRKLTIYHLRFY